MTCGEARSSIESLKMMDKLHEYEMKLWEMTTKSVVALIIMLRDLLFSNGTPPVNWRIWDGVSSPIPTMEMLFL